MEINQTQIIDQNKNVPDQQHNLSTRQEAILHDFDHPFTVEYIDKIVERATTADIPNAIIQARRNKGIGRYLAKSFIKPIDSKEVSSHFNLQHEDQVVVGQTWIELNLDKDNPEEIKEIAHTFELNQDDIKSAIAAGIKRSYLISHDRFSDDAKLPQLITYGFTPSEIQSMLEEIIISDIPRYILYHNPSSGGLIDYFKKADLFAQQLIQTEKFSIYDSSIIGTEIDKILMTDTATEIEYNLRKPLLDKLKQMPKQYKVTSPDLIEKIQNIVNEKLTNTSNFLGVIKSVSFLENFVELQKYIPLGLSSMLKNFNLKLSDLSELDINPYDKYIQNLLRTPNQPALLNKDDVLILPSIHISLWEAEAVKRAGINLADIKSNDDYIDVFRVLENLDEWNGEDVILKPFEQGGELFGFKQMFEYLDRKGLSRHDALHAFKDILYLQSISNMSPDQFYNQVLLQVMRDDSNYESGTSHHELNSIAQTLDVHFEDNAKLALEYKDIEGLGELAEQYKNPEQIFASWKDLKRYSKLTQLLGEREVLDALSGIENPKLRQYVTHLAFHKDSKVDMKAAVEFATDPYAFLTRDDDHAPPEVHDRKKPSNYIEIPNLGLTAQELVESLVDGKMDALSVFTPMEIEYKVLVGDESTKPQDLLRRALGTQPKEGVVAVQGEAVNPKKLFAEVNKTLKPLGISVQDYIAGKEVPKDRQKVVEASIVKSVFDEQFGIRKSNLKTQTYIAKIGRKSDPDMVLAGDDTVNCMPFGSGKNTVYTFNPNTAQFVIQVVNSEGKRRTIAQSVLTKDLDIGKAIPEILNEIRSENGHLANVLPEDTLRQQTALIACDNVEVSPNFSGRSETITALYRDFFNQYLERFAEAQGLQKEKVIIGEGYSDALNELPEITNTYAPQAPVSYSDKTNDKVRSLRMDESDKILILQKDLKVDEIERPEQEKLSIQGLKQLTFESALQVAYIEGKAYANNQSLIQYLHNMENGLIAKDINNATKNRSNMSLLYRDSTGKIQGYLFAYEGVIDDPDVSDYASQYEGKPFIYISDIASDTSDRGTNETGLSLMRGFVELYKTNYIDKNNPIPIFAQMKDDTSYKIIKKGLLNRLVRDLGVNFEVEELDTYTAGNSTMHPVIIRPVKI